MKKKYFPISQGVACQSKWSWSTLFLTEGITRSCHRASESNLTVENFINFHNTNVKIQDRQKMLDGIWPAGGCNYCKRIEGASAAFKRIDKNIFDDTDGLKYGKRYQIGVDLAKYQDWTVIRPKAMENKVICFCVFCSWFLTKRIECHATSKIRLYQFDYAGIISESS